MTGTNPSTDDGSLSDFGQQRAREVAKQRAETVDSETSIWWHRVGLLLQLFGLLSILVTTVSLLGFVYWTLFGTSLPAGWLVNAVQHLIAGLASGKAGSWALDRGGFR